MFLREAAPSTEIPTNIKYQQVFGIIERVLQARAVAELKDPPFQDVQHFVDVGVGGDAAQAQRTLLDAASAGTARQFAVGDTVQVAKGDLQSMRGHVVEIDESRSRVVVQPIGLEGFTEKLDFDMADLQKEVAMGARVKVRRAAVTCAAWPSCARRCTRQGRVEKLDAEARLCGRVAAPCCCHCHARCPYIPPPLSPPPAPH